VGWFLCLFLPLSPTDGFWGYFREIIKELGIVFFSVCTISFLYEILVAEKYLQLFPRAIAPSVERG